MKMLSLTCPRCDAPLEVAEGRQMYFCPYCGNRILLDDEAQNININYTGRTENVYREVNEAEIAKAKAKEAEHRHDSIFIIVWGIVSVSLLLWVLVYEGFSYRPVRVVNDQGVEEVVKPVSVKMPYSESEFMGEPVENVKAYFEGEGFLFIKLVPHKMGWFSDEGDVCGVKIKGYSVKKDETYSTADEVEISYYSEKVFEK